MLPDIAQTKIKNAILLLKSEGDNPEYDRALCELYADLYGKPDLPHGDRTIEVAKEFGIDYSLFY